jgi:hypothetical protein
VHSVRFNCNGVNLWAANWYCSTASGTVTQHSLTSCYSISLFLPHTSGFQDSSVGIETCNGPDGDRNLVGARFSAGSETDPASCLMHMYSYGLTTLTEAFPCFNTVIYVFLLLGLCIPIVPLPWLRFFRAFSSVVRQMPGYNSPSRGRARTLPNFLYCSQILCCSMYCLFCVFLCIVCV